MMLKFSLKNAINEFPLSWAFGAAPMNRPLRTDTGRPATLAAATLARQLAKDHKLAACKTLACSELQLRLV